MSYFHVGVYDKSFDGVLVCEFRHEIYTFKFVVIACYLHPEGSVYADSTEFFAYLTSIIYKVN